MTSPFGPGVSEEKFTAAVIELFRMAGWLVHHDRGEMRRHIQGDVGFPDILAVDLRYGVIVAAELKTDKGKATEAQLAWLAAFRKHGDVVEDINVYLWRPDDWDRIVDVATRRDLTRPVKG